MAITKEQLEKRKQFLGASEVASICGVNPWDSAWDVWARKTGRIVLEEKQYYQGATIVEKLGGMDVLEMGRIVESSALDLARNVLGEIERDPDKLEYPSPDNSLPILSHLDAMLIKTKEPVEGKSAGMFGPLREDWGESGTDDIPDRYIIQAQCQMFCTETETCYVPTIFGGRKPEIYVVKWNEPLWTAIADMVIKFWNLNVLGGREPDSRPGYATVKKIQRVPEKVVNLIDENLLRWRTMKAISARVEEELKMAELAVLSDMRDGEVGMSSLGQLTYFKQSRKEYTVKSAEYRVLRFKKNKDLTEKMENLLDGHTKQLDFSGWQQRNTAWITECKRNSELSAIPFGEETVQ